MSSEHVRPRGSGAEVAVVGAGMVGLATAWFPQERGIEVEVIERRTSGAGASWGNAGWLTPALTTPLPSPAVLGYGARAVLDPVVAGVRADRRPPRRCGGSWRGGRHRPHARRAAPARPAALIPATALRTALWSGVPGI